MTQHLNEFSKLVSDLKALKTALDDDLIITLLMDSLPSEFEQLRLAVEQRETTPGIDDLKAKILDEDKRRNEFQRPKEDAFAVKTNRSQRNVNCNDFSNDTTKRNVNVNRNDTTGFVFRGKCYNCNKFAGHLSRDCSQLRRGHEGSKSRAKYDKSETTQQVFTTTVEPLRTYTAFTTLDVANACFEDDEWCFDSGASVHICKDYEKFIDLRECENTTVSTAPGHKLIIDKMGTVNFSVKNGDNNIEDISVSNVLYAPKANGYLFVGWAIYAISGL